MTSVDEQIQVLDKAICKHIGDYETKEERGFLCQNILTKLRHFVEAVSVKASGQNEYSYDVFNNIAKNYISSNAKLKFLNRFHKYLQKTVSHYLPNEENSERLMLKYYEYLLDIKSFLTKDYDMAVLGNIDKFPIKSDPTLKEYYEKIVLKINQKNVNRKKINYVDRFYIRKIKPFFINQEKYYEVTFTIANDYESKFDRVIAFTKLKILPNYSVKLSISQDNINVFDKKMPIKIIDNWEVSIRPCELNYFADIFGDHEKITTDLKEYKQLMLLLTETGFNLVEIIELSDEQYDKIKNESIKDTKTNHIFNILDMARKLIMNNKSGSNILRYLLYRLNNRIIKSQRCDQPCFKLSNLNLKWGCIPFDQMPFITSPIKHNPKISDLFDCFNSEIHESELFARLIQNNTEQKGMLYTPVKDIDEFEDMNTLIGSYNNKLYHKHRPARDLEIYKDHIYINGYEQDTVKVLEKLKDLSKSGIKNYSNSVDSWLKSSSENVDCEHKKTILKIMFEYSKVALVYGAAGTGKTRLIEHISSFFHESNKLFLANTNPAINNLRSRISAGNSSFKTIASFLKSNSEKKEFDVIIIDECSTTSNVEMLKVLEKASFKLLVLVGDIFQIESIPFGNWFGIAKSFISNTSVFELTKPFRTTNQKLLELWDKTRNITDDILEHMTKNNYSTKLDESIFNYSEEDEIILCLNYDGIYGINNINNFLQIKNPNKKMQWGIHNYKVGDPILFNESNRFKPVIHNNLKGKISHIELLKDKIKFDIEINKSINELDAVKSGLELKDSKKGKSIISFCVYKRSSSDEDNETSNTIVPFQVSYAISIHKAQGLEYDSVKVIITDEIGEMITHNIFYTSITRSKEKLKIYWTPETEKIILKNLRHKINNKDMYLLKTKFNI